jgi:hypothetical protein
MSLEKLFLPKKNSHFEFVEIRESFLLNVATSKEKFITIEKPFIPLLVHEIPIAQDPKDLRLLLKGAPPIDIAIQGLTIFNLQLFLLPAHRYNISEKFPWLNNQFVFLYITQQ